VPNDLVRVKETSLNLKFNPYNISWMVKLARISFKLPNYIVSYYSGTLEHCSSNSDTRSVTALPLTKISFGDLEGVAALTDTVNNYTIPHYGKTRSGWRERRKSSLSQVASSSEWLLHCIVKNLIVFLLMTRSF
jgi:hypothetical protein